MTRCKGRPAYTPPGLYVRVNLQTGKFEARLERNESKNGKAANGKTLPSHRKWFRETESLVVILYRYNFSL